MTCVTVTCVYAEKKSTKIVKNKIDKKNHTIKKRTYNCLGELNLPCMTSLDETKSTDLLSHCFLFPGEPAEFDPQFNGPIKKR